MVLKPLDNFRMQETHHCVTGSLRHIYVFNGHDISEDMLLGIGGGVGFIYWHMKDAPPIFGGRRVPQARPFEQIVGERTGVIIETHTTASARKAEQTLLALLEAGQPVALQVDMGYLPYFDFGGHEYHFGGHVVVACGYDPETHTVLIADRDLELHPVPMDTLEAARGSKYKPFPPKHAWMTFDFSQKRMPTADEVRQAINEQADAMLNPPINNFGVKGIIKAGQLVPQWPNMMSEDDLRMCLFNVYIFISPVGGTGGGTFRYMFSRFLREAAEITGRTALNESAAEFWHIADLWEEQGLWFKQASESPNPASLLNAELTAWFTAQAECEKAAWETLRAAVS